MWIGSQVVRERRRVGEVEVDQLVDAQPGVQRDGDACRSAWPSRSSPTIWPPSSRPVPRSATSFTVIGLASGR